MEYAEPTTSAEMRSRYAALKMKAFPPTRRTLARRTPTRIIAVTEVSGYAVARLVTPPWTPIITLARIDAPPSLAELLEAISVLHGLTSTALKSASRNTRLSIARQHYYYAAAAQTHHCYRVIGRHCGGRDHATITWGICRHCARHNLTLPRGLNPRRRSTA